MTGEPGKPEQKQKAVGDGHAQVEKRTPADAEAALRQYEQAEQRRQQPANENADAIAQEPLLESTSGSTRTHHVGRWLKLRQPIGVLSVSYTHLTLPTKA